MIGQSKQIYEFGPYRLVPAERQLLRDGRAVALTPKTFDLLLVLVEQRGHLVEKDELLKRVWPDRFVEEANLSVKMSALRRVLGEGPNDRQYIETVPTRGYRFVAGVNEVWDNSLESVVQHETRSGVISEGADKGENQGQDKVSDDANRGRTPGLKALTVTVMLAGLAVTAFYLSTSSKQQPPVGHPVIRSMAVLPFKPLVAEKRDDSLALGMADTLITKLLSTRQIVVRPISAVRKYTSPEQDPVAAGREQGVDAVLDTSIQWDGQRIRVTARLFNVADGSALWTYKCDERCTNIFVTQDSISEKVAESLVPALTGEGRRLLVKHYTENAEAYQLYNIGRYYYMNKPNFVKGAECFNRAVEKDPNYALAYTGLADAYMFLAARTISPIEAMPKAKMAATKALDLDETLPEAHVSMGLIKLYHEWDWAGAETELRRAIEFNPYSSDAHRAYGLCLIVNGRHDESVAEMRRAQEVDPLSLRMHSYVALALHHAHRYDEAIEQSLKSLEMDPQFAPSRFYLGRAYAQKGMFGESITELQKAAAGATPDNTQYKAELGWVYAVSKRTAEARTVLGELTAASKEHYVSPYDVATVYAGLGDKDRAFAWLEKAYEVRARDLVFLKVSRIWDNLNSDQRFTDLLRRVGLSSF